LKVERFKINLLNHKYSIKLVVEIAKKYRMTYLKRIIRKFDKDFKNIKTIKYKKLETDILKNLISCNISKNTISY